MVVAQVFDGKRLPYNKRIRETVTGNRREDRVDGWGDKAYQTVNDCRSSGKRAIKSGEKD